MKKSEKISPLTVIISAVIILSLAACSDKVAQNSTEERQNTAAEETAQPVRADGSLASPDDIDLRDTDGNGRSFEFTYGGEVFQAVYTTDIWKIIESYRIRDHNDIVMICQALIDVHPIHGSDMVSYRTAEDMAYEWEQHNLAYDILPDDNKMKDMARDVDLDPPDQGRSLWEIFVDRSNREDISLF